MQQWLREHRFFLLGWIAVAALIAPALRFAFISWDDEMLITLNPMLHAPLFTSVWHAWTSYDPELYVPLTTMSYLFDRVLWGFSPMGFHATNLALHLLNVCLVYILLLRLPLQRSIATVAALLWAIHPLQVESIAWVSARKDLLAGAFALGSCLLFLHARQRGTYPVGSLLLFACGLLAKVSVAPLPMLLLLKDLHQKRSWRIMSRSLLPFFLLAILFALIAVGGKAQHLEVLTFSETILLSVHALSFYVSKLLWPSPLSIAYPVTLPISGDDPRIFLSIIALVVMVALLWQWRRSGAWRAWTWYGVWLLPSFLSFNRAGHLSYGSDHYAYLALLGLIVFGVVCVHHLLRSTPGWRLPIAAAVLLCSSLLFSLRLPAWQTSETLYRSALAAFPNEAFLHYNLGVDLARTKRLAEAKEALVRATELDPGFSEAWSNLASVCSALEEWDDAWRAVEHAIRANPSNAHAYNMRGVLLLQEQEYRAAIADFKRAITLLPDFALAYRNLGDALGKLGRYEEGLNALQKAHMLEQ